MIKTIITISVTHLAIHYCRQILVSQVSSFSFFFSLKKKEKKKKKKKNLTRANVTVLGQKF
jgi:hypothetical protein